MNYQKIYDNLIKKRLENPPTEKFEQHHIVPKSLGGSNDKENIVKLTLREHYIAHLLLCRIHRKTQNYYPMLRALNMMKAGREGDYVKNSRMFEYFRTDFARMMSEAQRGEGNSQYGTTWYYHPELKINKRFKVSDDIPEGFVKGRVLSGRPRLRNLREMRICKGCGKEFECESSSFSIFCEECRVARICTNKPKIDYVKAYDEWIKLDLTISEFAKLKDTYGSSIFTQWRKLKLDFESENKFRKLRK